MGLRKNLVWSSGLCDWCRGWMPMSGAMTVLVRGTVKSLKWRSVFIKAQYLACCSSSLCLKPCHATSALGSPGRPSPLCRWPWYHRWIAWEMCQEALHGKRQWRRKDWVNAGKTKIMICGTGLDPLQSSSKFPCKVCRTGVRSSSIFWNDC